MKLVTFAVPGTFTLGAAQVVDEQTLMPLGLMVGAVAGAAWMTWQAARLLHRLTGRLDRLETRLRQMDRRADRREDAP